jgi:hypothetical protein
MKIIQDESGQLHFEGRTAPAQLWWAWGGLFVPGMLALLLLPQASRFVGLLVWMVIWLALIPVFVRWMGVTIRVTIDSQARQITWTRNGKVTRSLAFAQVRQLAFGKLATGTRPYQTFQLVVVTQDGSRITLAVDPQQAEIERALKLARVKIQRQAGALARPE